MARPRKVSDEDVYAAAHRVMGRVGAAQLRLSEIAAEAGVTAGALVQRFGSKRGLLLQLTEQAAAATESMFESLRAASRSALDALYRYADCMAMMGEGPGGLAHHLGYLQIDLGDEEFHVRVREQSRATRTALARLVGEAVEAGELQRVDDAGRLARAIEVTLGGSLLAWAFHREGTARSFLRDDLTFVLAPYLAAGGRGGSVSAGRRKRAKRARPRGRGSTG